MKYLPVASTQVAACGTPAGGEWVVHVRLHPEVVFLQHTQLRASVGPILYIFASVPVAKIACQSGSFIGARYILSSQHDNFSNRHDCMCICDRHRSCPGGETAPLAKFPEIYNE